MVLAVACLPCRGWTCTGILLLFYSAPLSTMATVILRRNSASLYPPSCVMAFANGSLWTAYGMVGARCPLGRRDPHVSLPALRSAC